MKKKLLSLLLVICMLCTLLPMSVLAATPADNAIKLELVKDTDTFGKEVLRVDFKYKSGTDTPNDQTVYLKFSADKLAPLYNVDGSDVSSNLTSFSNNYGNSLTKNNYVAPGFGGGASEVRLYALVSGNNGYMCWKVTEPGGTPAFADFTHISSIFFGLKDGVTFDKLPKDIIKLGTPAEDKGVTNQTLSIEFTVNGSEPLKYNSENAADNNLTVDLGNLFVAGKGVTFAEPAKPAYSGNIAAPTVNSNAGGKVVLDAAVLTPADSAANIQYGYSTSASTAPTAWQDSTTFTGLTINDTLYFYAKVVGTTTYAEKVSAASAAVKVASKAVPTINTVPTASAITYGDKLSNSTLSGGAASVAGSFTWKTPSTAPQVKDSNSTEYEVVFTPSDATSYETAICKVKLTINAKDVSGLTAVISNQNTVKGEGQFVDPVIKGVKGEDLTGTLTYGYDSETGKSHAEVVTMLKGKNVNDVVTLIYTFTPPSGNYTGTKTDSFKVTVKDIEFLVGTDSATVANTLTVKASPVYGDDWSKIVKIKDGVTITAKVGTNTDTDQSHFTLKQTGKPGAGSQAYTLSYTGTIGGNTYNDVTVVSGAVDVAQKDVTITGLSANNKGYDRSTTATPTGTAVINGKVDGDDVSVTAGTATFADKNVGTDKTVTFSGYALSGTAAGNYTLSAQPANATADITAKEVTITGVTATNRDYAEGNVNVTVGGSGTVNGAISGDDVTVDMANAKGTMADANVGTGKEVTVTGCALGGTDAGNYKLKEQPIGVKVNITQATYVGTTTASGSAKYGMSGTVDLSGLIVAGGTATYTSHTDANNVLDGTPAMDGTTLKFAFVNDSSKVNKTATVTATVTSVNYANYDITVTVTVNDKLTPVVNAPTAIAGMEYNGSEQVLIAAGSTTGGTLKYSLTSGSGYSTELPKAENAGNYTVYYKVEGNTEYADVAENNITVNIGQKAVTVAPKAVSITKGSAIPTFELAYSGLVSGESLTPSATPIFTCYETGTTTPVSTSTAAGTYTITWTNMTGTTFTGAGSTNYTVATTATANLTISNPSYSGGGSYTPSYTVSVDKTENGTITVSPKSASKGDTVTITVKPDKGYELEMLKALDKDGDALKLTEKNGKYTFTMPTGKVTVKGSFVEEAPVQIFKDVPVDAYYYEAVKWAAEKDITGGVGNGLFAPNQPCTRAQIVTFLWRAAGSPAPKNMSSFADVPADAFYAKAVAWAVENAITGGTGDGKFSPDATCTRAQAVTFLYRAAGSPKVSGSAEFGDVATNAYYADAVAWAAKNGITGGIGGGLFGSGNDCTRAQIVTFLYRSVK